MDGKGRRNRLPVVVVRRDVAPVLYRMGHKVDTGAYSVVGTHRQVDVAEARQMRFDCPDCMVGIRSS